MLPLALTLPALFILPVPVRYLVTFSLLVLPLALPLLLILSVLLTLALPVTYSLLVLPVALPVPEPIFTVPEPVLLALAGVSINRRRRPKHPWG